MNRIILLAVAAGALALAAGCEREPADDAVTQAPAESADADTASDAPDAAVTRDDTGAAGDEYTTTGIVTAVDREAGRVTIDHAPIDELNWPPMTMAFEVQDKNLLADIEVDDEVEFTFVEADGKHVIRAISG